jgi:hypothetical protein
MEIEKERIRSLLQEIEKRHEEGLISDETYAILKRDYEENLLIPSMIKVEEENIEQKVFFTPEFTIKTERGSVQMNRCFFVPVILENKIAGAVFFGEGSYRIFFDDMGGTFQDTTLILKDGFMPEGEEVEEKGYIEKARKEVKGVSLQYGKDGWWIRNRRERVFGLFSGWSCELFLSDTRVELKTPTQKFLWNGEVEFKAPAKEFHMRQGGITLKTPTTTIELTPESLSMTRPAEKLFLSSNEFRMEKPARKVYYKNWEEGIAPYRRKMKRELEDALKGFCGKEELDKYKYLFEGEERGEKEILVEKPASRLEMGEGELKVETPTSKLFLGKDGKIFLKTPTSHISLTRNGEKYSIDKMDEMLRDFNIDFDLTNLSKSFRGLEEKMEDMHGFDMPPIPPIPPTPPIPHDGEYLWKGTIENPVFFVKCHGDVEVKGRGENEYEIRAEEDGRPDFRVEGGKIYIVAHEEIRMRIPKSSQINIDASGDVQIRDIEGALVVHSSTGNVELKDVECDDLTIVANSGDAFLKNISGKSCSVTSSSGSVEGELRFKNCSITVYSGDADLDLSEGNYSVEVLSGDITIETSETYKVDAVCEEGDVEAEGEEKGSKYSFSQDNPKTFLTLHASSGDIKIN